MAAGKAALTAKKYEDAAAAFANAGKVLPGDKDAAAGLKSAQDAAAAVAAAAAADAAKKAAEAKRQADLANLMTQGQTALAGKKYDDAAKATRRPPAGARRRQGERAACKMPSSGST